MSEVQQPTQTQPQIHSDNQQPSGSTSSQQTQLKEAFESNDQSKKDAILDAYKEKFSNSPEKAATANKDAVSQKGNDADNLLDALEQEATKSANPNEWEWAEGVKGEGTKPDWLRKEFKSAQAQAKAYNDLVKKFGDFKGAPEAYDFKNVENSEFHVHPEAENTKKFVALAKEMNLSQEGFDKILGLFNKAVAPTFKGQNNKPIDSSAEIAKLGEGGREKVNILDTWLRNNHPDDYGTFRKMMKTADDINALWRLRSMTVSNDDKHSSIMHRSNPGSVEQQHNSLKSELKDAINSKDQAKKDAVMQKYRETFSKSS